MKVKSFRIIRIDIRSEIELIDELMTAQIAQQIQKIIHFESPYYEMCFSSISISK